MIMYCTDMEMMKKIPSIYPIINISKTLDLVNWSNAIYCDELVPDESTGDIKRDKRRYLGKVKEKGDIYIALNILMSRKTNADSIDVPIVFVASEDDIEEFNYIKILSKYIKKVFGITVFPFTFDITFSMIDESKLSYEGEMYYTLLLSKYKNQIDTKK